MVGEKTRLITFGEDLKLHDVLYKQLQSVELGVCSFTALYFRLQQFSMDHCTNLQNL